MKKFVFHITFLALVVFGVGNYPVFGAVREISIGHVYAETNTMNIALEKFAEVVKQETNGEINVNVLHSGVLGGEMEHIAQVIGGLLDGAMIGGTNMLQNYNKRAAVEDLPFLYRNEEHERKATDGLYGQKVKEEIIEPLGVKHICYIEHGFRHFTNNVHPIYVPEDMKGLKIRVPQLPLRIEWFKFLGANPVPIALPELFTALQQGAVDGQENPLSTIESSKFYEVQKYLSLSNHSCSIAFVILNNKVWASLTEKQQAAFLKAGQEATKLSRELYDEEAGRIITKFKDYGMKINSINREAFVEAVQPVWEKFVKEQGRDLLDLIIETGK